MRRRNPHAGLVVFWVKLMQRGYKRSILGLYRFLKNKGLWFKNFLISSTSLSLMSRCLIPDKESRSMSSLSSPAVCSMRQKGKDFTSILQLMNIPAGATWKPLRNTAPIPPLDSLST